jgi:hypothetical protein
MNRYALVNRQNIVDNIILWDGQSQWSPPQNMTLVNIDNIECDLDWVYDGTKFNNPNPIDPTQK